MAKLSHSSRRHTDVEAHIASDLREHEALQGQLLKVVSVFRLLLAFQK